MEEIYVKPICSWISEEESFDYFLRYSQDGNNSWKNIRLTKDSDKASFYFIVNFPQQKELFDPFNYPKTILFQMEPSVAVRRWREWSNPPRKNFLQVRNHKAFPNNIEWHLNKTWSELDTMTIEKSEILSTVVSAKHIDKGHEKRLSFLRYLEEKHPYLIDIYGKCESLNFQNYKGRLPFMEKETALFPYKYHFNAENNREFNYITEKCADAILSETLIFYYGAPNIEEFFPGAVICLDLEDFERDYKTIIKSIEDDEYSKRLPAIKAAKRRILNEYSIFPTLESVLNSALKRRNTFCINLERREDRKREMKVKLEEAGIGVYTFWPAVDGRNMNLTLSIFSLFEDNDFGYKKGVMGCALSHYNLWRNIVDDVEAADDEYLFILEDDVRFSLEFPRYFDHIVTSMYKKDPSWDMLFLSYQMFDQELEKVVDIYRKTAPGQAPVIKELNTALYIGGFHSYLITKSGARKLCAFIKDHGIKHGIDYIPKRYKEKIGLKLYETQYHLCEANWVYHLGSGDTDIQVIGDEITKQELYKMTYPWNETLELFNI